MVSAFFAALTDASVYVQVITDAGKASIGRITFGAASDNTAARLALAFIKIVSFFTLDAARLVALLIFTVLNESALLTLSIAHKKAF